MSLGMGALRDFVGCSPSEITVAFVPTAGDPYENPTFVDNDRQKLREMGFQLREFDIKNKNPQKLKQDLENVNMLYVAGGNTFYLLEKIRSCGLDLLLPELLDQGMLYVGASAGAVVVGPDLEPIKLLDEPEKAPTLQSTKALGLVPFIMLPHYSKEKDAEVYNKIEKDFREQYEIIMFTDQQAIVIADGNYEIVASM
jgi:dipeptidase E